MYLLCLVACRLAADGPVDKPSRPDTTSEDTSGGDSSGGDSSGDTDTGGEEPAFLQGFVPRNVVVIAVDTLRADRTPWYGADRETMPLLSARTGWITWERAYATSGWTAPATTSILTGLDVHHHAVRMVNEDFRDELTAPTFATRYSEQGFATIFVSGNELFGFPAGLTAGFDSASLLEFEPQNASVNLDAVLAELDLLAPGTPFAVHAQPFDPHQPWRPVASDLGTWVVEEDLPFSPEDSRDAQQAALGAVLRGDSEAAATAAKAAVRDIYDEELLGLDRAIDAFLVALEERGLLEDTLVILTADHGETLFDRGDGFGHGRALYEELVRVPLVFYNPAFVDAIERDCLASTMDLHPTVWSAMGLPLPAGLDGRPMQDGCRALVTQSIYRSADATSPVDLVQTAAGDLSNKLLRVCGEGAIGFDLSVDPGSLSPIPPSGAAFDTLASALDELQSEAAVTWPGTACVTAE